jgi:dTDP-4-dehydrorhamnose reductase
MKRVLIIGATGMLGHSLAPFLIKQGYIVAKHGRSLSDYVVDMTNYIEVKSMMTDFSPEIIINLAANTDVDMCESFPNEAYLSNTSIVENIVKWVVEYKSEARLIQISTDQVYDGHGPHLEDKIKLTNYYAFSKYSGEIIASKIKSTILRTNFVGKSKKDGRSSFSDWIINSIDNKQEINVFDDIFFSPLTINTLIRIMKAIIEEDIYGVYNLGSTGGMSKADFSFIFANSLNMPTNKMNRCSSIKSNLKAYRPKDMRLNCSKFELAFRMKMPTLEREIELLKNEYS